MKEVRNPMGKANQRDGLTVVIDAGWQGKIRHFGDRGVAFTHPVLSKLISWHPGKLRLSHLARWSLLPVAS